MITMKKFMNLRTFFYFSLKTSVSIQIKSAVSYWFCFVHVLDKFLHQTSLICKCINKTFLYSNSGGY